MRLRRMDDIGTASILDLAAGTGFLPQSARSADSPLYPEGAFSFFEKWARGDTGRHRGLLQGTRRSARMVASKKKKSPAGGQPAGLFSWKGGNRFGRKEDETCEQL